MKPMKFYEIPVELISNNYATFSPKNHEKINNFESWGLTNLICYIHHIHLYF